MDEDQLQDEDKLRAEVNRAIHAKALLNDELLVETLDYLKQAYLDAWSKCTTTEMRENNWYLLKGVERFKEHLELVMSNGILPDRIIAEMVRRQSRRAA